MPTPLNGHTHTHIVGVDKVFVYELFKVRVLSVSRIEVKSLCKLSKSYLIKKLPNSLNLGGVCFYIE